MVRGDKGPGPSGARHHTRYPSLGRPVILKRIEDDLKSPWAIDMKHNREIKGGMCTGLRSTPHSRQDR